MNKEHRPLDPDACEERDMLVMPERQEWKTLSGEAITPDGLAALLGVYAEQFSTYATLVWQAPALSLTGQSFLMTIVLGDNHRGPKFAASTLSLAIAYATIVLMQHHRGRQVTSAQLARRLTIALGVRDNLGVVYHDDAIPSRADAVTAWDVYGFSYVIWQGLSVAFALTSLVIIYQVLHSAWHVPAVFHVLAIAIGLLPLLIILALEALGHLRRRRLVH
jgi:hypothetical protein